MAGPFFTRPNFEDRQMVQYSGRTITLSGDTNINQTGNLRIQKGAFPGLVATSLDTDGTVVWGPVSGLSWSISACTSPLYVNNLVSCPSSGGTIQVDAGNLALNSELNFLISLSAGTNTDEILVIDNNGYVKTIPNLMGIGNMWHIPVGYTLTVPDNYQSFIYGDILIEGTIDLQTNAQLVILNGNLILSGGSIIGSGTTYLVTLGGNGCCFTGGTGSCITDLYVTNIHGCSPIHIQPTSPDDVYLVEGGGNVGIGVTSAATRLHVSGTTIINSDDMMLSDTLTTIPTLPNFKGLIVSHDYSRNNGIVSSNTNPSGSTAIFFANDSLVTGQIGVGGSQSIRAGSPVDGVNFYRNKIVLRGNSSSDGMIFNPNSGNLAGTFWWEFAGISGMILKGNGGDRAYLGLALNPDGTEMPTSNLQIGGTGTTGTFKYRDGNQQSGYVLTSDSDGNATWQVSTGGGSGTTIVQFTGNTSGSCITDLWVTNVHGCSPITIWDQLQHNGCVASGLLSTAFGSGTTASGDYSHAEGYVTIASGPYSHAEGRDTQATFDYSHAEGRNTIASNYGSHAEGNLTVASGILSHAEGRESVASNYGSHAEGQATLSSGQASHAEGNATVASGDMSHAEGYGTIASGNSSHAEGKYTIAGGDGSHSGGWGDSFSSSTYNVIASGRGSFNHSVVDTTYIGVGASNLGTFILGGFNNSVSTEWSGVLGGQYNIVRSGGLPVPYSSVIVGGSGNILNTGINSVILGGSGLTGTTSNTVYVPDFVIKRGTAVPTSATDTIGEIGSITYDNDYLYVKTPRSGGLWGRVLLDTSW